jgi:4-hydroxy-3-polyprenylbenzoate decarboxylase
MAIGTRRVVVGISGGSGIVYGIRMLQMLRAAGVETHLVLSRGARITLSYECDWSCREINSLADAHYSPEDLAAPISSGSFRTCGMVVAPCSVKSLAQIATGVCDTLLTRAADVTIKERRRLVLMVRETPLSHTHLHNMTAVTMAGAIIAPPVPAFYTRPSTIEEIVDHSIARVLDLLDIDTGSIQRWGEISTLINENPSAAVSASVH